MKILYFGSLCDEDWFNSTMKSKGIPSRVAQYSFEKALVSGFTKIQNVEMEINYLYQEEYYPKGKYLRFKKKIERLNKRYLVKYLSNINLPILKEIFSLFQGLIITLKWGIKNSKSNNKIILTPFNYTPLSFGIYIAAKILGIKRVNIFTDLSSDVMNSKRQKEMHLIKKVLLTNYIKMVNFIESSFDGYIIFTEPMNKKINPTNKPSIVIEGIFNNDLDLSELPKEKAIMYAGTLAFEYGVKNILDAFLQIKDPKLELWLFGNGDMKSYIEELTLKDKRIKFFGFKSRKEVFEYEKRATLLINTRNPNDEYTKYSFPSKTFEYMISGTPFLTTKLDSIPKEYYKYILAIENSDTQLLKNKIVDILNTPPENLKILGKEARKFILNNKNSTTQSSKIYNWIINQVI